MPESKALALFGNAELSTAEVAKVADLVGNAGSYVIASGRAIAEYNRVRTTAVATVGESHESTAKTLAIQIALFKSEYIPPKGKAKGDSPTYGEVAKALTISPTYFSQLGTIGEAVYCNESATAHTLAEWYTPSTLIKLIPLKESMLTECAKGIEDGTLTADMSQDEVKAWVDERITHEGKVEPVLVIFDPLTEERTKSTWTEFLAAHGYTDTWECATRKTGVFDEVGTLKVEWVAHIIVAPNFKGSVVYWTHKHRIPKPTKDEPTTIAPVDPIAVLKQSLARAGYDEDAIEMVLAMQTGE